MRDASGTAWLPWNSQTPQPDVPVPPAIIAGMDNMYRAAAWSLLLVIVLAGCGAYPRHRASGAGGPGPGQAIPVGSSSHTISVGGTSRTFLVGVVTTSTASCPDSRTVELITIAGAGGQWPGATPNVLWPKSSCTPTRSPRR